MERDVPRGAEEGESLVESFAFEVDAEVPRHQVARVGILAARGADGSCGTPAGVAE